MVCICVIERLLSFIRDYENIALMLYRVTILKPTMAIIKKLTQIKKKKTKKLQFI